MSAALKLKNIEQNQDIEALPVAFVTGMGELFTALSTGIDAAILNRVVPQSVIAWLDKIAPEHLPAGRYVLEAQQVGECLRGLFGNAGEAGPELDWLCEDAQALAAQVDQLSVAPRLRLRLEPIFDNACSKMHIDNVHTRLICTYRGPGTDLGMEATQNDALMTVPTGLPILLKGKLWPGSRAPILQHKSPAIKGTGLSRLVLVLEGCPDADIIPDYDQLY